MRKILIIISAALFLIVLAFRTASAADKNVICNDSGCNGFSGSLFSETNIVPGSSITKTFEITNNKSETIDITFNADEGPNSDDPLSQIISAVIYKNTSDILFSGNLDELFIVNNLDLGNINQGTSDFFEVILTLPETANNDYQGKTVNFSLTLQITGQESRDFQVLGSTDVSNTDDNDSGSSDPENENDSGVINQIIGQVLGLSDTSSQKLQKLLSVVGLFLILAGSKHILTNIRLRSKSM